MNTLTSKKRKSPRKHRVGAHTRDDGTRVSEYTRGSGVSARKLSIKNKIRTPITQILVDHIGVEIRDDEEGLYGTFFVKAKTLDGRTFEASGNWDVGGHPGSYGITRFFSERKFSGSEKKVIKEFIVNELDTESSVLSDKFQDAYGYAMEDDW